MGPHLLGRLSMWLYTEQLRRSIAEQDWIRWKVSGKIWRVYDISSKMSERICCCHSVTKLCLTLWPHGLQHVSLPCPSLCPGVCSNPCPLSQWGHPTISSSIIPFSSCPQSFPASGSFPMSQLSTSSGQSIGASASASVVSMNNQGWFYLGLTGLISLLSKGLSQESSPAL